MIYYYYVFMTRLTEKKVLFSGLMSVKLKDFVTSFSILTLLVEGEGFIMYFDSFGISLGCVVMD